MAIVATSEDERTLLRTHRIGLGLLNAMFAEQYCGRLAHRSELTHKLSLSMTTVLSTGAVLSLFQVSAPWAAPYLAVASAAVSGIGSVFAWRSRALAFAKASRAYGDQVVEWSELWDTFRSSGLVDQAKLKALELKGNEIGDIVTPLVVRRRLGRRLQRSIRRKVGLTQE